MAQSISSNSLSLLDNTSGWCKLLFNTDEELNLHNRFSNNLKQILDQSNLKIHQHYKFIIHFNL